MFNVTLVSMSDKSLYYTLVYKLHVISHKHQFNVSTLSYIFFHKNTCNDGTYHINIILSTQCILYDRILYNNDIHVKRIF